MGAGFLVPGEQIERDARCQMRLELIRIDLQGTVVQLQRLTLPPGGVEAAPLLHELQGIRRVLRERRAGKHDDDWSGQQRAEH
jgi:hypothetical protein